METRTLTPIKAIRAKCLECAGGRPSIVRQCESIDCALHFYRFGRNPNRKFCGPKFPPPSLTRISDSTQDSKKIRGCKQPDKTNASSGNLEAFNAGIKIEPMEVGKGRITIHRKNKVTTIKVTEL